jgi:carboxymethylenebutenolidase
MLTDQTDVTIPTPDGSMPAFLCRPMETNRNPAILLLMEAFGLTSHMREVALRLAREGYGVLVPDLYYRELPDNTFGYDQVEAAMAMMWGMDFGEPVERDLQAAIAFLKSQPGVDPNRIGVTGFCLGGGLTFLAACRFSAEIAAAAPFYGMVLDEWIEAVKDIAVPMYLFFGGKDPFIGQERIHQIEARLKAFSKAYTLKIYPEASHGFFCHERSSYHPAAAADSWQRLQKFFRHHLG